MGKLNVALCSGLSPITTGQAAELLGVSRRTVTYLVGSGLPTFSIYSAVGEGERPPWRKIPLEIVVALGMYVGAPGTGRPWGRRRDWDHSMPAFLDWYKGKKGEGYGYRFVSGHPLFLSSQPASAIRGPILSDIITLTSQTQAVSGAELPVGSFQVYACD